MGASGAQATGYTIDQSIRFDQSNNASMSRTFGSAGSRTTWTFSWWWKRGNLSASTIGTNQRQPIFGNVGTGGFSILSNHNSSQIDGINIVYDGTTNNVQTSQKFRDASGWYHFIVNLDTTNNTEADRIRMYLNGERITQFASISYPSKDATYNLNNNQLHQIGIRDAGENLDGYLAEMHFLDGYAYGPEYFGEFKEDTDIWIPKEYTGSYGSNGFYIDGRDSSDLGDDESGNGNDFTTTGMAAHDQVPDSPTHNFATYNATGANDTTSTSRTSLTNGNLQFASGDTNNIVGLTIDNVMLDGYKWYFEIVITGSSFNTTIGFRNANNGDDTPSVELESDGQIKKDGSNVGSATGGFSAGDIFGIRLDWTNTSSRKISFYKNNTLLTGEQTFSTVGYEPVGFQFYARETGSGVHHLNCGQNGTFNGNKTAQGNSDANGVGDFYYAVPSGHFAITHQNLNAVS